MEKDFSAWQQMIKAMSDGKLTATGRGLFYALLDFILTNTGGNNYTITLIPSLPASANGSLSLFINNTFVSSSTNGTFLVTLPTGTYQLYVSGYLNGTPIISPIITKILFNTIPPQPLPPVATQQGVLPIWNFTVTPIVGFGTITYNWLLDNILIGSSLAPNFTETGISNGPHTIAVYASNNSGNGISSATTSFTSITIPSQPSQPVVFVHPDGITVDISTTPIVGDGVITYNWYGDGAFIPFTSSSFTAVGSNGTHMVYLTATNSAGTSIPSLVTVAHLQSVPAPPANLIATVQPDGVSFALGCDPITGYGVITYHFIIDAIPIGTNSSPSFMTGALSTGNHNFEMYASNSTGISPTTGPIVINALPIPPVPTGLAGVAHGDGITFDLSCNTISGYGTITYHFYIDGIQIGTNSTPTFTSSALSTGTHTFQMYASNSTGNSTLSPSINLNATSPGTTPGIQFNTDATNFGPKTTTVNTDDTLTGTPTSATFGGDVTNTLPVQPWTIEIQQTIAETGGLAWGFSSSSFANHNTFPAQFLLGFTDSGSFGGTNTGDYAGGGATWTVSDNFKFVLVGTTMTISKNGTTIGTWSNVPLTIRFGLRGLSAGINTNNIGQLQFI